MLSSSHQFTTIREYAKTIIEIGVLWFLIYQALRFVRGTRAAMVLAGMAVMFVFMTLLAKALGLEVIEFIMSRLWTLLAVALLIIFQPEIRRAFAELGRQQSRLRIGRGARRNADMVDTLIDATYYLAGHRIGALVAVERSIGLRSYTETGTYINAPVSSKLLSTIFFPNTPLHDGGVVIRGDTLIAAGCIFPLTQNADQSRSLGHGQARGRPWARLSLVPLRHPFPRSLDVPLLFLELDHPARSGRGVPSGPAGGPI